ncbi:hypothetical protein DICPUDRAFT_98741 [Dictyostelium purpureum]|uniref:Bromo domain-containing protein n=1 Tax=Dictyostelium purpureum TaxID=5786 RepID=F0ZT57_DICPU|nr:uncharacterized protein DICPUDRAFT_98741 [Dictyostelium purpureum]EGC32884.1 hypothetical protein DICPUDRAFT_98741 [Dictyostelium purpureum]|eukprot:XP_003290603.1 hypothetical protein DICPUDRAFT_98741 [Dictyostelium purpureum]
MAKDKDKGNLTGFLFGNVKESGELDVEDNDQVFKDLKKDLELFAKSSQHISFKKTLGIDEEDKTVGDQIIIPDKNAKDFEDEDEMIDEIQTAENEINKLNADTLAKAALQRIQQQQKQREDEEKLKLLQQQELEKRKQERHQKHVKKEKKEKKKKIIDDFDFDEEEESDVSSSESSSMESDDYSSSESSDERDKKVTMKSGSYEVVKCLLERPNVFTPEDPEFKTFVSGKSGGSLILKFSQLFAPKFPDKQTKKKSRRVRILLPQQVKEDSIETDEVQIWNQPSKKQPSTSLKKQTVEIDSATKKLLRPNMTGSGEEELASSTTTTPTLTSMSLFNADEDDEYVPEPLQETENQEILNLLLYTPDEHYHSLQQVDWEENIIWDENSIKKIKQLNIFSLDSNKMNNNNVRSKKQQQQQKQQHLQNKQNKQKQQQKSNENSITELPNNNEQQEIHNITNNSTLDDMDILKTKIDKWSLFPISNEELESGEWVENIIWDESMVSEKLPVVAKLVLDLNDREMYFEEHMEKSDSSRAQEEQAPTKKKSKKRLLLEAQQAAAAAALARAQAAAAAANGLTEMTFEEQLQKEKEEEERREREEREQSQREIDKFNLSNDKFYKPVKKSNAVQQNAGKATIQHSLPGIKLSLVKTHLTKEDLIYAHRPRLLFPSNVLFKIALYNKEGAITSNEQLNSSTSNLNGSVNGLRTGGGFDSFSGSSSSSLSSKKSLHKSDLSGRDGRVVLVEYTEQNPPLLSNVGMGMKIRNYYRKKSNHDSAKDVEFEDGELVVIDSNDDSPFLGDIYPGQAVQAVVNNLYKSPVYKHNSSNTDFLLVRSRDGKRWYIRDLGPVYSAGQMLPEIEVPAPNSRSANMFLKSRLQAYIYRLFLKKSNSQRRLKITDICSSFPSQSETSIRKRLKDCADFQRGGDDSGWWTVKDNFPLPTEEELQKLVTPEVVCAYESMLIGLQRLQDNGIIHFTAQGTIPTILGGLDEDDPIKKSYKPVEDELSITPWNLTGSFQAAMQGKGRMQIISEDPTAREDEFCYLKMPQKVVNQKQKAIKLALQKNQVTGTDADLRKLSLSASKTVLLELGVSEEKINSLTRWQRIDLVRKKSSEAALASDSNAAMTKFARGSKYSLDHQHLQYKEQCQLVFDNQMKALKGEDLYEDELDPDFEDLQKDLEDILDSGGESNNKQKSNPNGSKVTGKRSRSMFGEEDIDEENEEDEQNKLQGSSTKDGEDKEVSKSTNKPDEDDLTQGNRIFVKRTTLFQKPDGTLYRRIEIIRDPKAVEDYQKKKPDQFNQDRRKFGKVNEEDEERKKERRKLESKIRKLKRSESRDMDPFSLNNMSASSGGIATIGSSSMINISAGNIPVPNKPVPPNRNNMDRDYNNSGSSHHHHHHSHRDPSSQQRINVVIPGQSNEMGSSSKIRVKENSNLPTNSSHRGDRDHHRDSSHRSERDREHRSDRDSSHRSDRDSHRSEREHRSDRSDREHRGERDHHREHGSSHRSDRDHHKESSSHRSDRESSHRDSSHREHRDSSHRSDRSRGGSRDHRPDHHRNSTEPKENTHESLPLSHSTNQSPTQVGLVIKFPTNKDDQKDLNSSTNSTSSMTSSNRKKRTLDQSNGDPLSAIPESSAGRRNRVRKDGGGAEVELSNIFESILEKLRSNEEFLAFKYKVTPKVAPDYHTIIKNPIDLTTMRERNRQWEYKSKSQFMAAIKLMVSNCFQYNEHRYSYLLPIAEKLQQTASNLLSQHDSTIAELEKSIEQTTLKQSSSNLLSSSDHNNGSTPATPISLNTPNLTSNSPFFPPVDQLPSKAHHSAEDEEIDIVSLYESGVSPSVKNFN